MAMDVYQTVTDQIVAMLEGAPQWRRTWSASASAVGLALRANGTPYLGMNQFMLQLIGAAKGYASPYWVTFKGALEVGGNVRKGEKAATVIFYSTVETRESKADKARSDDEREFFPVVKAYYVFNADQCEGLPSRFYPAQRAARAASWQGHADVDAYFANTGIAVDLRGDQPCYQPWNDTVVMPPRDAWSSASDYYATQAHEFVHATAHPGRAGRDLTRYGIDLEARAYEELIAELGAAFVCAKLNISNAPRADHAAYVASWLKALKGDKRFIFKAAAEAQKAVSWLDSQQPVAATSCAAA